MKRLTRSEEFAAVRDQGRSVRTSCFHVAMRPQQEQRLGVITSRRVGNAVQRNRIRRVVREHFRLHLEMYPRGDCVVIAFASAATKTNKILRENLERALEKLRSVMNR